MAPASRITIHSAIRSFIERIDVRAEAHDHQAKLGPEDDGEEGVVANGRRAEAAKGARPCRTVGEEDRPEVDAYANGCGRGRRLRKRSGRRGRKGARHRRVPGQGAHDRQVSGQRLPGESDRRAHHRSPGQEARHRCGPRLQARLCRHSRKGEDDRRAQGGGEAVARDLPGHRP